MNVRKSVDYSTLYAELDEVLSENLSQMEEIHAIGKAICEVLKKHKLYKASFSEYDRFIILCDGQYAACLSSKSDSENILSLAKEKNATMCEFTLDILRLDDCGNCVLDSFDV